MTAQIYVQIPAYRDTELPKTLLDLYAKAERPARLRTCVVWQHAEDEILPAAVLALPNLEIVDVPHHEVQGCNWARNMLQERWAGEPYTLLLDSHHRFVRGWDGMLLEMHAKLRARGVAKPLLTGYLPPYRPNREPGGRAKRPYKMYPLGREDGLLTKLTSYPLLRWTERRGPVEADFLSLHFIFVAGDFNREVSFDPEIYFFGDEVAIGLKAYTLGYDLFHPHVIVGWHCFDRSSRVPHWDDHEDWHRQQRDSLEKLRRLFLGLAPDELGSARTIADYEDRIMMKLVEA
jgi:hypothetical protein